MMLFFREFRPRHAFAAAAATLLLGAASMAAEPATPASPPAGAAAGHASPSGPSAGSLPAAGSPGAQSAKADPVVAKVNNQEVRMSDLNDTARTLPEQLRNLPPQMLYSMLLNQLIDRKALAIEAKREGLDKDPAVQRQMEDAADRALQNALIQKEVGPKITEEAVKARYEQEIAGKPGAEEVHARHILVPTEDEAKKIIAQLKAGSDFAALAKASSKDPGASQGGDLGWFKQSDMVPEFAAAAFALKPGQYTETPVHTQFGWHVIQVLEKRRAEPPSFDQAKDQLRQKMIQEGVQKTV
ncbi:MAG: peptidylprolyl isomerase, partial [Acetobacteraceae bacterium]|nr:peptidylprolyl isomerase [Acetobacteraceae bacterium]